MAPGMASEFLEIAKDKPARQLARFSHTNQPMQNSNPQTNFFIRATIPLHGSPQGQVQGNREPRTPECEIILASQT